MNGYAYIPDKFNHANLTAIKSDMVSPPRVMECPAQMEAVVVGLHEMMQDVDATGFKAFEVRVLRTHVHEEIRMNGTENRIDTDKWRPMIMSFQELYGLKPKRVVELDLAIIREEEYRGFTNAAEFELVQ